MVALDIGRLRILPAISFTLSVLTAPTVFDKLNRLTSKKCDDIVLEQFSYENGGENSAPDRASKYTHTEYINEENGLKTTIYLDYTGRETASENSIRKTEKEYYADRNLKREKVFDNSICVSDVLYLYNDRGMLDTTFTGYKPGESYFISKNIYTPDGLLEYEIVYLDAQKTELDSPVLPQKAKASITKYEYDEYGNVLTESIYTGDFSTEDIASVKFAEKTTRV